jgi:hypothetical protein
MSGGAGDDWGYGNMTMGLLAGYFFLENDSLAFAGLPVAFSCN